MGLQLWDAHPWVHIWWGVTFTILTCFFLASALGMAWYGLLRRSPRMLPAAHAASPAAGAARAGQGWSAGPLVDYVDDARAGLYTIGVGGGAVARASGLLLLVVSLAYPLLVMAMAAHFPPLSPGEARRCADICVHVITLAITLFLVDVVPSPCPYPPSLPSP